MVEKVRTRLATFGYTVVDTDNSVLNFLISKVTNYVLNFCNIKEIPAALEEVVIDMIVGEFLLERKLSGQLLNSEEVLSSFGAVSSIKEGDISIDFEESDADTQPLTLLNYLIHGRKGSLIRFRKLVW